MEGVALMRQWARMTLVMVSVLAGALAMPGTSHAGPAYGFVGIQIQGIDKSLAEILDLPDENAILVRDVAADGPGAAAGLRRGDLILSVNGKPTAHADLLKLMQTTKPGDTLTLVIRRNGKEQAIQIPLADWHDSWAITRGAFATLPTHGITLSALTGKLKERFRDKFALRWGTTGVLVTIVDAKKAGEDISLVPGDVILQINQQDVWLPKQFTVKLAEAKKKGKKQVLLMIQRPSGYYYMLFPIR
ncbi:PDZ domain-containing protein [Magnetospira sp. QH-2]|uniref:PDZ domain-containing protein n=1 Tax=Magnetospira sp. (strain QH-2) TaxID=1288970 RepID=UPI0003E81473|nr:PDZ domain-containing protein [Magnetospira sp. QH-2]CCQ72746.1 exported protein of unknown function [Magnetospira sp. QH-2]